MARMIKWTISAIRFIAPWIWRALVFAALLVFQTLASIWVGIPTATDRIAHQLSGRAIATGVPQQYDRFIYWGARGVALITIMAGWVLTAYLTVWFVWFVLSHL